MKIFEDKKLYDKLGIIFRVIVVLICTLPVVLNCLYILPATDDFVNAYVMKTLIEEGHTLFSAAIERTINLYFNTSGYFFASFLNMFFTPLLRWDIIGIRLFCLITNLLFFGILYFFVKELASDWLKIYDRKIILTIYMLVVFCFTNLGINREAYFWYCVSVAYVLPIIVGMIGIICFSKALVFGKWYWTSLAALAGFLVSGSSLNVTALICSFYLLIGIVGFWVLNRKKISLICFGFTFFGAIVNVIAPGNYVRHDYTTTDYNIVESIIFSVKTVLARIYELMTSSLLPFILILLFVYILYCPVKIFIHRRISLVYIGAGTIISLFLIVFPVALGYATGYYPERCIFVQDFATYIYLFVIIIHGACMVKEKWEIKNLSKESTLTMLLMWILCFSVWHKGAELEKIYPSLQIIENIVDGENAELSNYWESILNEIADSENDEVIVRRQTISSEAILFEPGITADGDYWGNGAVAKYYGKSRVVLEYSE